MTAAPPDLETITMTVGHWLERCRMHGGEFAGTAILPLSREDMAVLEALHARLGRALDHGGVRRR